MTDSTATAPSGEDVSPLPSPSSPGGAGGHSPAFIAALLKAQARIQHAELDCKNEHYGSKYASLKSIIDAVKPHLVDAGIWFTQVTAPSDKGAEVVTRLIHAETGERMDLGHVFVPSTKLDAHGMGGALTYAQRYSLRIACGIAAEDDDDGNRATNVKENAELVEEARRYLDCVRDNWDVLSDAKGFIANEDKPSAVLALNELAESDKHLLWKAPTKGYGSVFSTAERRFIKEG